MGEAATVAEADPELTSGGRLLSTLLQKSSKAFPEGWVGRLVSCPARRHSTNRPLPVTETILFFTFSPPFSICLLLLYLLAPEVPSSPVG